MDFETSSEDNPYADIPTRPMRVKVLYSFDTDNKTNCLARFPNTLQIPAVAIDETSQVGVIELKQCISAVLSASPELISRLSDGDFTIYAFDYSEFETPLVGQGMLSAVLTALSPANDSEKTMITGRVCMNVPAIFSNGVKETLEVKLRLVPVPKPLQMPVTRLTDGSRSGSPAMSAGFDPNAWNASMQHHRPPQQTNDHFTFDSTSAGSHQNLTLVDEFFGFGTEMSEAPGNQQMLANVGAAQTPTEVDFVLNPAFATNSYSAPGSRAGSPIVGSESSTFNDQLRHQSFSAHPTNFADHSRAASRGSARSEVSFFRHKRQASTQSLPPQAVQQETELYYNDDDQPRKRAKVVQTDWHGKASFGSRSSDLRVTAAAANSIHMHRPIPKRPSVQGSDLEPPPRVPTPVPSRNPVLAQQRTQQSAPPRSMLRQASTADSDIMSDYDQYSDAIMSSPEEDSPTTGGTPQDIPSSPPVFPGINQTQPSSPGLPTLPTPRMADSGYMSERGLTSGNIIESLEDDENRSPDAQDYKMAAQMRPRGPRQQSRSLIKTEDRASADPAVFPSDATPSDMEFHMVMPGDEGQLPQKMLLNLPRPSKQREGSQGPKSPFLPANRPATVVRASSMALPTASAPLSVSPAPIPPSSPESAPKEQTSRPQPPSRRSSLALPPKLVPDVPAQATTMQVTKRAESQKPAAPKLHRKSLKRSRTTAESEAGSPAPSDTEGRPRGPKRSGSGATRRVVIQDRLEQSLASGEAPQFCAHCGAIETPTWRRLYVKHLGGKPCPLDEAEGEGEIIGVEATECDEDGEILRYVIRKTIKKPEKNSRLTKPGDGFEQATLCNPCGLWFNKTRTMRPSDRWGRKVATRNRKKKADGAVESSTDGLEPQSEAFFTDQVALDEGSEDVDGTADDLSGSNTDDDHRRHVVARRPRANSLQLEQQRGAGNVPTLETAPARQVQSSPIRFGSQNSPIEIDNLTPKPTRRLLFPSPRGDGESKSLDDNGHAPLNAIPSLSKHPAQSSLSASKLGLAPGSTDMNVFKAFTADKENIGPPLDDEDPFAGLFDGSPTSVLKTARKTPSKGITPHSQRQHSNLIKTPTSFSRKRKPLFADQNAANNASMALANAAAGTMTANDFMTSPSSSRYFLRSTPSRAERTPGQSHSGHEFVSPFSCHLAQMLSEANDSAAAFTSPSRGVAGGTFDFSDLPTFTTPGRQMDWSGIDEMLGSEFAAFDERSAGISKEDR